jgi:formylmethanofuran dehydrogenase subunit B
VKPAAADASDDGRSGQTAGVCTACSLLCDDVVPDGDLLRRACAAGQTAWRAARSAAADGPRAWVDGRAVSWSEAIDHAAACLGAARRVLVTGLADGSIDAIAAACELAESLGAAIDPGEAEAARATGPVVARVGRVTADWEELRDRAALVVFWFCAPPATHPRFIERFVTPTRAGGPRRTIAVGPAGVLPVSETHAHVPLPATAVVTAARALHGLLAGPPTAGHVPASLATLLEPVRHAIDAAPCAAFVTGVGDDPVGLGPWSTATLVRSLALTRPVFEVPLDRGVGGGADAAGAAAVCTWRYGAAGAIGLANRAGAAFRPAEADAVRLVTRGEVDAVVAAGGLSEPLERAISARRSGLTIVRLVATGQAQNREAKGVTEVLLRVASPLLAPLGTMLRGDGRWIEIPDGGPVGVPEAAEAVLRLLTERLAAAGGRRQRITGVPAR